MGSTRSAQVLTMDCFLFLAFLTEIERERALANRAESVMLSFFGFVSLGPGKEFRRALFDRERAIYV